MIQAAIFHALDRTITLGLSGWWFLQQNNAENKIADMALCVVKTSGQCGLPVLTPASLPTIQMLPGSGMVHSIGAVYSAPLLPRGMSGTMVHNFADIGNSIAATAGTVGFENLQTTLAATAIGLFTGWVLRRKARRIELRYR